MTLTPVDKIPPKPEPESPFYWELKTFVDSGMQFALTDMANGRTTATRMYIVTNYIIKYDLPIKAHRRGSEIYLERINHVPNHVS